MQLSISDMSSMATINLTNASVDLMPMVYNSEPLWGNLLSLQYTLDGHQLKACCSAEGRLELYIFTATTLKVLCVLPLVFGWIDKCLWNSCTNGAYNSEQGTIVFFKLSPEPTVTGKYEYSPGRKHIIVDFTFADSHFAVAVQLADDEGYASLHHIQLHKLPILSNPVAEIGFPDVVELDLSYLKPQNVIVTCTLVGDFHEVHLLHGRNLKTVASIVLQQAVYIRSFQIRPLHPTG